MSRMWKIRVAVSIAVAAAVVAAVKQPAYRSGMIAFGVGTALCWVLGELFALDLERIVGLRYLHRGRRSRGARVALAAGAAAFVASLVLFVATRGRLRSL